MLVNMDSSKKCRAKKDLNNLLIHSSFNLFNNDTNSTHTTERCK